MSTTVPASVADLENYVKASLGYDVVVVELSTDQLSIAIENALQVFFDRVYDATEKVYVNVTLPACGTASGSYVTMPNSIVSVDRFYGLVRPAEFALFSYVYEPSSLLFNREYTFNFSRYSHRLTVNETVDTATQGIAHAYKKLDETVFTDIYAHEWLKKYAVALATVQWGNNLTKFTNVPLPGGMTLNGESILARGKELVREATEELEKRWDFYPLPIVS